MTHQKMHDNEFPIDEVLVRQLLIERFPDWAGLPIAPVASAGTDNALFRLGDEMAVRLPRIPGAAGQVEKEQRWLPELAPHLPLAIPAPLGLGAPGADYPWHWSINRWLAGENATIDRLADPIEAAHTLGSFIVALRGLDASGGPAPGGHNSFRGEPLSNRDTGTRNAIAACEGLIDTRAALAAWDATMRVRPWTGRPAWIHGDLQAGNLLAENGRFTAVIDFGCLGIGDPAGDLLPGWSLFSGDSRVAFREAVHVDEATWARGRGWALSVSAVALPYYRDSNPMLAGLSRFAIEQVIADYLQDA